MCALYDAIVGRSCDGGDQITSGPNKHTQQTQSRLDLPLSSNFIRRICRPLKRKKKTNSSSPPLRKATPTLIKNILSREHLSLAILLVGLARLYSVGFTP